MTIIVKHISSIYCLDNSRSVDANGAIHLQYHSRFDESHYRNCDGCWDDHHDFMLEQEMDR